MNQLQQVRWQSQKGEGDAPEWKQWGFEDVRGLFYSLLFYLSISLL